MADEKLPLLNRADEEVESYNDIDNSDGSKDSTYASGTFRIPIYGTHASAACKIVPRDERVIFSWSDINVFATVPSAKTSWIPCGQKFSKTFSSQKSKHILKNATGIAYPGELLALMGSSGAGKTTLLNSLTFRNSKKFTVTGIRRANGTVVTQKSLISTSAYVQQDDLFIGTLTVREHLIFQSLVRMDRKLSYQDRLKRIEEVLQEFALKKCENTIIGTPGRIKGLSGGERKRLSFAAEVLTNPTLMFCDEPTSGLDSFMALNIVQNLKNLALSGKTIICTIHQPSSELYAMFDKLLLMAEGRGAFLGTPEEADTFFSELSVPCPRNFNPADYFIQLLAVVPGREEECRTQISKICDRFEKSDVGIRIAVDAGIKKDDVLYNDIWTNSDEYRNPYKASWWSQFRAVLWRSCISILKEPLLIKVRMIQSVLVSILVGFIYFNQELNQNGVMNINGALFILLTNMTFQNCFAVITVFSSELPIFLREHKNGMYRTDVYFICKTLAETPLFIIIPFIFTTLCYFMIGFNPQIDRYLIACGIVTLVANVATSFGYCMSCVATNVSMALALGPTLIIPFILFGGFFLNVTSIPVYLDWLSYLSWFKYGYEALQINQWANVTDIMCETLNSTCPRSGNVVLEMYNFRPDRFMLDIIALCLLIVFFRVLGFISLLTKAYTLD